MAKPKSAIAEESPIEQLTQKYNDLNTRKIQANNDLKHARARLETLQREARENYGTDDLDELRKKLAAMKADNETKINAYRAELDAIEKGLAEVEAKFSGDESIAKEPA